ncbi:uncharacterized protein LOC134709942 [Mytilus trossulus]|uniref:uncharacterized protein LOC134709942 n=1 Tax=Mytilus trossulus TaxID=6551 RepID=UPI00300447BC
MAFDCTETDIKRMLLLVGIIFITMDITSCKLSKKKENNVQSFLEDELKEAETKGNKCSLKKINVKSVNQIRWTRTAKEVIPCAIKLLTDNKNDGFLWSVLGTLYDNADKSTDANFCFKQATRITGKITPFIKQWNYLGPFVIGKTEFDGDPLEAFGGIYNVSKYREHKNQKFYSEFSPGGEITWQVYNQRQPKDVMKIAPTVNWNELINTLSSMGITEWQGWVIGEFSLNDNRQNVALQCLGHHTIYVDGIPVTGDVYHRNQFYFGLQLNRGLHSIYVRLRGKVGANLMCSLQIKQVPFEILNPHYLPDIVDGHVFGKHIAIPVANYHFSKWIKISKIKLVDQSDGNDMNFELLNQVHIAPGQILPINIVFESSEILPCENIQLKLKLLTSEGNRDFLVNLRCRKLKESFLFTFLDHDGSVQHAAAIYPLSNCMGESCPVLLTLHGTTVPPQNQADSYKYMVDKEFVYGVDGAWLLAPTRHGAHNWEGPGVLTALTALDTLSKLTDEYSWLTMKADQERVIFSGHSMGGHGALNLATHYPDRALALISLAGWIKKEEYGDSNLFFRHDIAASHVDPGVKFIMESSITENDVDRHVSNLKHVPVLIRTGAADKTVPPFYLRRMYRLLREIGAMVNYTEPEGKEHWWWDTKETNDGGVVNDKYIRDFTAKALEQKLGYCRDDNCKQASDNKYSKQDHSFTYTCVNPAFGEGLRGFQVIQQITPFRLSQIKGSMKDDTMIVDTTNVLRFSYKKNNLRLPKFKSLQVDGSSVKKLEDKLKTSSTVYFCRNIDSWEVCTEDLGDSRGPSSYGPARRVAEKKFYIVIGTQDPNAAVYIQKFAVYIANLFFLTSDTTAVVIKDEELENDQIENSNLIIIGSPKQNSRTDMYLKKIPVKVKDSSFSLSKCKFDDPRSGLLTLAPNGKDNLVFILMSNSYEGLYDVISLATPTIPPMTRSPFSNLLPDYVVTGPEYGLKGPGGFLCTGFWGNSWEYRTDISSCVC